MPPANAAIPPSPKSPVLPSAWAEDASDRVRLGTELYTDSTPGHGGGHGNSNSNSNSGTPVLPHVGSRRQSSGRASLGSRRGSRRPVRRPGVRGFVGGAVASTAAAGASMWRGAQASGTHALAVYMRLTPLRRALVTAAGVVMVALTIVMMVFSHRIFAELLGPVARRWHELPGGWVLAWLLVFVTAFPPVIGYSTACTLAGVLYGFPAGWPLAATGNVVGSLAAFLACRTALASFVVDRLGVGADHRFQALGHVLRRDGLPVLAAVRFCPLPYSLSNGFLATIPNITPAQFALSTAIASPKLLVHVFIGSRLAALAEAGDEMSAGDRALNYISMGVFGLVGTGVGLIIYRRTMARAAEIAEEEGRARASGGGASDILDDLSDDAAPLMDPNDADVAALMDDDDISLWETPGVDGTDGTDGDGRSREGESDADDYGADDAEGAPLRRASTGSSRQHRPYHDEADS